MTETSLVAASMQPELWTASSNDTLKLFITDSEGAINFSPLFTYPIFGDSETIYGYKDLVIFLCFDHFTFAPFLNIKYSEKLDDPDIEDPKSKMLEYLPESVIFKDEVKWVDSFKKEKVDYKIPGTLVTNFTKDDDEYEIYKLDLQSPDGLELHKRLQIFVLLLIEAGSYIDSSDPLWHEYVLYKKGGEEESSLIGFTTAYNYWKYPGHNKFQNNDDETRLKISQFVILPPYQGKGIGGAFYTNLFRSWLHNPKIVEIVVEDPNESFDDLRDRCDLEQLATTMNLSQLTPHTESQVLDSGRKALKLEKRQFARLIEMILLYKIKHNLATGSKKDVRLLIKRRLFEKNKEGLLTLDDATKKDKLQSAYLALEEDYYRILGDISLPIKRMNQDDPQDDPKKKKLT